MKKFIYFSICFLSATLVLGSDWNLLVGLTGEIGGDDAGWSVALNSEGSIVAIGEIGYDAGGPNSGRVRIFENNGSSWDLLTGINGEVTGDQAGFSVALNAAGSRVAIGEIGYSGNGFASGRVRIFENNGGSWNLMTGINGNAGDQAGWSVALNSLGSIVAISELGYSGDSGRVKIFEYNGSSWILLTGIIGENNNDRAGYSVALNSDGSIVAIGEIGYSGGDSFGRVRIFENNGSSWILLTGINGENNGDRAGSSVALNSDGSIVAFGEPRYSGNGSNSGRVRIFENNGSSWILLTGINGETGDNLAGSSVALNSNGSRVAIGEVFYDAIGVDSGRVRIFEQDGNSWNLMTGINGLSEGDNAGYSVSLNSEGSIVAIGEPFYTGSSTLGLVRIYQGPGSDSAIESKCRPNYFMRHLPFNLSEKTLPGNVIEKMVSYDYLDCLSEPIDVVSGD